MKTSPKGIQWDEVADLGIVSDEELARRLGVTSPSVRKARVQRGVPPAPRPSRETRPTNHRKPIAWDDLHVLGRVPDKELAGWLGIRPSEVTRERLRRGIPRIPGCCLDWMTP